jgi:hypothetical protein
VSVYVGGSATRIYLTGIDFPTQAENCLSDAGPDDGAVLLLVVDHHVVSVLDVVS